MQVFLVDPDPIEAATWLFANNSEAVTCTIREGQQLLSVSAGAHGMGPLTKLDGTSYSTKNHKNHPWAVWLRQAYKNWHYLFQIVYALVFYKCGEGDIRLCRLQDYMDNNPSLDDLSIEGIEEVPFFPHRDLADDPRLKGLTSFEWHKVYCEVKYGTKV